MFGSHTHTCPICHLKIHCEFEGTIFQDGELYHTICLEHRTKQLIAAEKKAAAALTALGYQEVVRQWRDAHAHQETRYDV